MRGTVAPLLVALALLVPSSARAQESIPVEARQGRFITSMGQPGPWGYFVAGDVGLAPVGDRLFSGQLSLGFQRALLNPMLSALSVNGEYFQGIKGNAGGQVGFRAGFEMPIFRVGAGWQYEFRKAKHSPYLTIRHPLRRGGLFWPGGQARILWTPGKDQSLSMGITAPLGRPFAGKTRPREVEAFVANPIPARAPEPASWSPGVQAALDGAEDAAQRIARLTVPYLGPPTESVLSPGGKAQTAISTLAGEVNEAGPGVSRGAQDGDLPLATVQAFHGNLTRAFQDISRESGLPAELFADAARRALLNEVVFPYNRLLGRKKASDTFRQLAARARVAFARELVLQEGLELQRIEAAEAVFSALLEVVEGVERRQASMWDDDRLAFLPPQLALLPEDHDTQAEINDLLSRAVEEPFTQGNRGWYVVDEEFEWELLRMIHETRSYHVLWIHDFRGFDDQGDPDAVAYRTVLEGYLDALADRVESYDQEGALPVFLINIDQWFYQANQGRFWLKLLEDPMGYDLQLPQGFEAWEAEIRGAQERLRQAVANSRLLQAEAREYGADWLRNRIKVHVNVTNPADATFWTRGFLPWVGFPDVLMRDHRKITFFDVDPQDPMKGRALFTGMGVGEHYNGATWDDRALLVQGPVLQSLRNAARELLLQQGFEAREIPYPLADPGFAPTQPGATLPQTLGSPAGASQSRPEGLMLQAHNWVGYGEKMASVLKATLYALMPPGAVTKAPDSLWNFPLWASLVTGHALRGGRVMVVAPSYENAPAQAFGSMALAQNLMEQVVAASQELRPALDRAGGFLKVGMYHPSVSVGDIPGKTRQVAATYRANPWLRGLHGMTGDDLRGLETWADSMEATGFRALYLDAEALEAPKLHMKAHFFATREGWDPLVRGSGTPRFLEAYLNQRAQQVARSGEERDLRELQVELKPFSEALYQGWVQNSQPSERERAAWYLMLGSHNQNFRSAMLDGEVLMAVGGQDAMIGLADFMLVLGLCEWVDQPQELAPHFPEQGRLMKGLGNWARIIF